MSLAENPNRSPIRPSTRPDESSSISNAGDEPPGQKYSVGVGAEELWVESYQGEVFGETFFGLLADRESDSGHRHQLEVLTRLERETKLLAEPVFDRNGFDRRDSAASTATAVELAGAFGSLTWDDLLGSIGPITDQFLAKYRELVGLCDDAADRSVAEAYVAHEEAIAALARRGLGQEHGDPVELILALPHFRASQSD